MTDRQCWHPDLLRRFVPTPYVFGKGDGPSRFFVESNDLEIALCVRRSIMVHAQANGTAGLTCKLIRDSAAPEGGSEVTIVSNGTVRVLYLGKGTILILDHERSELLGFVARNVRVQELVSSLLPALFSA